MTSETGACKIGATVMSHQTRRGSAPGGSFPPRLSKSLTSPSTTTTRVHLSHLLQRLHQTNPKTLPLHHNTVSRSSPSTQRLTPYGWPFVDTEGHSSSSSSSSLSNVDRRFRRKNESQVRSTSVQRRYQTRTARELAVVPSAEHLFEFEAANPRNIKLSARPA